MSSYYMPNKDELKKLGPHDRRLLYEILCSDIARFREVEWRNAIIFTTSIAVLIYVATTVSDYKDNTFWKICFQIPIVTLAGLSIFYTLFAHCSLAESRVKRDQVGSVLKFPTTYEDFQSAFLSGFVDHCLILFIADLVLAGFAIYKLWIADNPCFESFLILFSFSLTAIGIFYLCCKFPRKSSRSKE